MAVVERYDNFKYILKKIIFTEKEKELAIKNLINFSKSKFNKNIINLSCTIIKNDKIC